MNPQTNETPNYSPTPHLLAFVDALGFSKEISSAHGTVADFFKMVDHASLSWKKRDDKGENLKVTTIGDSVILAMESQGTKNENGILVADSNHDFLLKLYNLSYAVAELQVGLALRNIWTRGAITYDQLHFSPTRIVGPAFHRAYFLESNIARVPRVIVDGELIKAAGLQTAFELITYTHRHGTTKVLYDFNQNPGPYDIPSKKTPLVRDVPTFVDFAAVSNDAYGAAKFVIEASKSLSSRLSGSVEHFAKYRWLADYLHYFAEHDLNVRTLDGQDIREAKRLLTW